MADRRTARTQRAIYDAFITLLSHKKLNQITVAELSREADLGRGTFYLHYKDIYDLYDHVVDDWYRELEDIYDESFSVSGPDRLALFTDRFTRYMVNNKQKVFALIQPESGGITVYKLRATFSGKVLGIAKQRQVSNEAAMRAVFVVSGVVGVLEEWVAGGLNLPQKQVAAMLQCFLQKMDY